MARVAAVVSDQQTWYLELTRRERARASILGTVRRRTREVHARETLRESVRTRDDDEHDVDCLLERDGRSIVGRGAPSRPPRVPPRAGVPAQLFSGTRVFVAKGALLARHARRERLGQVQEGTGVRVHRVRLRREPVVRAVPGVQGLGLHEGDARRLRALDRVVREELGRRRWRARGGEDRRELRDRGGVVHRHRTQVRPRQVRLGRRGQPAEGAARRPRRQGEGLHHAQDATVAGAGKGDREGPRRRGRSGGHDPGGWRSRSRQVHHTPPARGSARQRGLKL